MEVRKPQSGQAGNGVVVSPSEARRNAIMDCAQALFFSKSYELTTVQDIISQAGLSKGGFYHHFSSKGELLDAILERFTQEGMAALDDVLSSSDLGALEQLNLCLDRVVQWETQSAQEMRMFIEALVDPRNAIFFQRFAGISLKMLKPILIQILEKGVAEGIFHVSDANIVSEVFIGLENGRLETVTQCFTLADAGDLKGAVEIMEARIDQEAGVVEQLLGVAPQTVVLARPEQLRAFFLAAKIA